ncbi:MAG: hypothetical protein M3N32_07425, partial [Actinomycetota bacterium]|nr:hypothetical protein [Actinomycetota bacterium]
RRSELLGMRWPAVDLEAATLTVLATLVETADGYVLVDDQKTPRSSRTIHLNRRTVKRDTGNRKCVAREASPPASLRSGRARPPVPTPSPPQRNGERCARRGLRVDRGFGVWQKSGDDASPTAPAPESAISASDVELQEETVDTTLEQSINEGVKRLRRTWPGLLATGTVGGLDLGLSILGLLIV